MVQDFANQPYDKSAGPCLQGATRLRRTVCHLLFTVLLFCVLLSAVNCLLGLVSCWLCVLPWAWKDPFYLLLALFTRLLWGHTTDLFLTFFSYFFQYPLGDHVGAIGCHSGPFWLPFCLHFGCRSLLKISPKCIPIFNMPKPLICIWLHTFHYFYDPQGCQKRVKIKPKSPRKIQRKGAMIIHPLPSGFVWVLTRK